MSVRVVPVLAAILAANAAAAQQYDPAAVGTPPAGVVVPAEQKAIAPAQPGATNPEIGLNPPPTTPPPPAAEPRAPSPPPAPLPTPGVSVAPSPKVTASPRAGVSKKRAASRRPRTPRTAGKKPAVTSTTGPDGRVVISNER